MVKCYDNLFEKIRLSQSGNKNELKLLIEKFQPLIKKYARLLAYEDANSELTLFLIEVIFKINIDKFTKDAMLVSYIAKSLKHKYIELSKHYSAEQNAFTDFPYEETLNGTMSSFENTEFFLMIKPLTAMQQKILTYLFYLGYSASDTAKEMNISRQAVNQCKNRALKQLKHDLSQ